MSTILAVLIVILLLKLHVKVKKGKEYCQKTKNKSTTDPIVLF